MFNHPGKSDWNFPDTGFSFKDPQTAQRIISPSRAGHSQQLQAVFPYSMDPPLCLLNGVPEQTADATLALERSVSIVISKFCSWPYMELPCPETATGSPQKGQQSGQSRSSEIKVSVFLYPNQLCLRKKSCTKGFSSQLLLRYSRCTHPNFSKGSSGYLIQHAYLKYSGIKIIVCFCREKRRRHVDKWVYTIGAQKHFSTQAPSPTFNWGRISDLLCHSQGHTLVLHDHQTAPPLNP